MGYYLEAADHGQGVGSFDFFGKNGEKRALSPEVTVAVGGFNLNFNPNGEGSHGST